MEFSMASLCFLGSNLGSLTLIHPNYPFPYWAFDKRGETKNNTQEHGNHER
jgi:hypothetical protein